MTNPINAKARGWIYLVGAVVAVLTATASPTLSALGATQTTQAAVLSIAGALSAAAFMLARANLTDPDTPTSSPAEAADTAPATVEFPGGKTAALGTASVTISSQPDTKANPAPTSDTDTTPTPVEEQAAQPAASDAPAATGGIAQLLTQPV